MKSHIKNINLIGDADLTSIATTSKVYLKKPNDTFGGILIQIFLSVWTSHMEQSRREIMWALWASVA